MIGMVAQPETLTSCWYRTTTLATSRTLARWRYKLSIYRALWWQVDDIDALRARLVGQGVRISAEPQDEPFGRTLSFADPEGNILSAFQPK